MQNARRKNPILYSSNENITFEESYTHLSLTKNAYIHKYLNYKARTTPFLWKKVSF
jgi:hypothetical protein